MFWRQPESGQKSSMPFSKVQGNGCDTQPRYSAIEIVAIVSVFVLAAAPVNLMPVIVGIVMDLFSIEEAQAGFLMTVELLAASVTVFLLAPWAPALVNRRLIIIAVFLVMLSHTLTALTHSTTSYLLARLLTGSATGLLLLGVNMRIATCHDPVKLYGICTASASTAAMLLFMFLPVLSGVYGPQVLFTVLAGLGLLVLPLQYFFPKPDTHRDPESIDQERICLALCVAVIAPIFLVQLTQSSYFAFVERMGSAHQITSEGIGWLLGGACLAGILSSALAAWIGYRWGQLRPLVLGLCGHSLAIVVACTSESVIWFYAAVIAQTTCYFFSIPYQLGLVARLDPSGRMASIGSAVFFFGVACGPVLGGWLLEGGGYSAIALSVAISVLVSIVIFSRFIRKTDSGFSSSSNHLNDTTLNKDAALDTDTRLGYR
jgi:predicted MFS family arabinose efflux permease